MSSSVQELIQRNRDGDSAALEELLPVMYNQLRRIAARFLREERPGHTLTPTGVVHEAYLRLAGADLAWEGRAHFLAVASGVMRRVLVDHARNRNRFKRGAGASPLSLEEVRELAAGNLDHIIDLDEALQRLEEFDSRKARIIEFVYFGGLTQEEAAASLRVSVITVNRDLRLAKAWLERELATPTVP
ncbi:MAG TPA: ECF-type sigma factor [Bryobacteraceae bacterium]|nr:ECF-type sigma factor [Bryobacteraceae bacterium]